MSTESQVNANRRNAQSSTGPRTPEGKSISSGNATKHGLSGAFHVLPHENQQQFDELIADFHRTFAPANACERLLVEEMVQSRRRVARIRRLEIAVIEQMIDPANPADAEFQIAAALLNNTAAAWHILQRYAAAAERSGYRAFQQLLALRKLDAQATRDRARQNEPNPRRNRPNPFIPFIPSNSFTPSPSAPGPFEQLFAQAGGKLDAA